MAGDDNKIDIRTEKDKFAKIPISMFDGLVGYVEKHASYLKKKELISDLKNVSYQQK